MPPYLLAIRFTTSLAAGMYVAFGFRESFLDVNRKPKSPRLPLTATDESTFCITSAITVR